MSIKGRVKVKTYLVPRELKEIWPDSDLVYTIDCYTDGRTWSDLSISAAGLVSMGYEEYMKIMKENFECESLHLVLYFKTKSECERAIEFLEPLLVMNTLSN